MAFKNFYKQMKAPYAVYADFECTLRKINTCEPDNKQSFTLKTEKHKPCGFSYFVVRSDGQTFGPTRLDSSRLEPSRIVLVKVDSTYWKSSGEGLSVKYTKDMG